MKLGQQRYYQNNLQVTGKFNKPLSTNNHMAFNGGFRRGLDSAAQNRFVHTIGDFAERNASKFEAEYALGITCLIRPLTIVATPSPNKRDNQYAAAHSISSGILGLATTLLLTEPVVSAGKNLQAKINLSKLGDLKNYEHYEKIKNMDLQSGAVFLKGELKKVETPFSEQIDAKNLEIMKLEKLEDAKKITKQQRKDRVKVVQDEIENLLEDRKAAVNKHFKTEKEIDITQTIKDIDSVLEKNKNYIYNPEAEKGFLKRVKAFFNPVNKIAKVKDVKIGDLIEVTKLSKELEYLKNSKAYKAFNFIAVSYGPKLIITPLLGVITIGLITPIMKTLFPKKDTKIGKLSAVNVKSQKG